jgi:myo-inositol 2-dehydrogenase / D-chiro-inositol 1-dehydrogenase
MPATKLRYGVIGVGSMGREHIENIKTIDGAEVVAISDPVAESRNQAATILGDDLAIFTDHQQLLDSGKIDAVIIATPNYTHVDILKDALATDLAVFVEKPLTTTVEDALKVYNWSKDRKAMTWVGLEYRYMPPVAEAIRRVHEGVVGEIAQVAIREHREPFYPKVGNWNRFREKTGGTLVEKCCHYFNLMDLITGENPTRVFASGSQRVNHLDEVYDGKQADMLDSAYVIVEYPSGARGLLDLCMFAENSMDNEHLTVVGSEGKVESFLPSLTYREGKRGKAISKWDAKEVPGVINKRIWDYSIKYPGHHYGASYLEHVKFFDAVLAGSPPEITVEEGLRSVAVGLAAHKSIDEGRAVLMSEVLPSGW